MEQPMSIDRDALDRIRGGLIKTPRPTPSEPEPGDWTDRVWRNKGLDTVNPWTFDSKILRKTPNADMDSKIWRDNPDAKRK
jgi:hypothetical protein